MSIALCCVDIIEFLSHEAIFLLFKHCILVILTTWAMVFLHRWLCRSPPAENDQPNSLFTKLRIKIINYIMSDRVVRDQLDIQMSELNNFIRILSLVYSETANVFKNSFYEFGIRVDSCEFTEEISNCSRSLPSCDACLFERRSIKVDILSCVHGVGRYHAPSILLQTIITVNDAFIFHLIRG